MQVGLLTLKYTYSSQHFNLKRFSQFGFVCLPERSPIPGGYIAEQQVELKKKKCTYAS